MVRYPYFELSSPEKSLTLLLQDYNLVALAFYVGEPNPAIFIVRLTHIAFRFPHLGISDGLHLPEVQTRKVPRYVLFTT